MLEHEQIVHLRSAVVPPSGNRVALAIELVGKRQGEVAEALDMSQSHLSDICRGRFSNLHLATLRKLSAFFGCAIEDLFPTSEAGVTP